MEIARVIGRQPQAAGVLYLRGAQGRCCRHYDEGELGSQGRPVPALWRHFSGVTGWAQ